MRGLPVEAKLLITKAREAAILAVETYNRPTASFRSGAFVILMIVAWTALFHAAFVVRRRKPYYRKRNSKRFEKVDGDYKAWELGECLKQYYGSNNPPERANLEFFIPLRHKLEHRSFPKLDTEIFGECQALLMNFEQFLTDSFGKGYALRTGLTFALQFSEGVLPSQSKAMTKITEKQYSRVKSFVSDYRYALSDEIGKDQRYSFRVFLVPKVNNHASSADAAVEFVKYDPQKPEEMKKYEHLVTFIKERKVPVANLGYLKSGEVIGRVAKHINAKFSHYDHKLCYLHFGVRPSREAPDPAVTKPAFCIYDQAHDDYVYTPEWTDYLVKALKDTDLLTKLRQRAKQGTS